MDELDIDCDAVLPNFLKLNLYFKKTFRTFTRSNFFLVSSSESVYIISDSLIS